MPETNADVFLELKSANGEVIEGDCNDQAFAGMIEIDDFEMSARSMASMQKEKDKDDEDDEDTPTGKPGTTTKSTTPTTKPQTTTKKKKGKSDDQGVFTLKITKDTDSSSTALALSYSKNLRSSKDCFPSGKLIVRKRGGSGSGLVFLTLVFKNLFVVNYSLNLSGGKSATATSIPEEDIEFVFESVGMKYVQQTITGRGTSPSLATWNFKTHDTDANLENDLKK